MRVSRRQSQLGERWTSQLQRSHDQHWHKLLWNARIQSICKWLLKCYLLCTFKFPFNYVKIIGDGLQRMQLIFIEKASLFNVYAIEYFIRRATQCASHRQTHNPLKSFTNTLANDIQKPSMENESSKVNNVLWQHLICPVTTVVRIRGFENGWMHGYFKVKK